MSAPRLYCPQLCEGLNTLDADESHHAVSVLRVRVGDAARLFDGQGRSADAAVRSVTRRSVELIAGAVHDPHPPPVPTLTLLVASPRTPRQGFMIEKCVELGVDGFVPLEAERSVVRPDPAMVEKWRRRTIEALKQCGRSYLPPVHDPMSFPASLRLSSEVSLSLLADRTPLAVPFPDALEAAAGAASLAVWIGPEGGWSDQERRSAAAAGLRAVQLGSFLLRTETAAIAVAALTEAWRGRAG